MKVMEDDQRSCGGEFHTNEKGKVPPLVTTKFLTRDMGHAGKSNQHRYYIKVVYNFNFVGYYY
jgi:hypothetical protein